MKSILIKAYTALNLGDDLFIKILCDRYPQHQFTLLSPKKDAAYFETVPNLTVKYTIPKVDGLMAKLRAGYRVNTTLSRHYINKADLVIHIGGSIFIQDEYWKTKVKSLEKDVNKSKDYYIIGSNFGPYNDEAYQTSYKNVFSKTTQVSFRDTYSYDLFDDLNNVCVAPDVVFSYESQYQETKEEKTVVISVIDLDHRKNLKEYKEEYESKIIELCNELTTKNHKVLLMGFCKKENDDTAINRIKQTEQLKYNEAVSTYNYEGDMDEALALISQSKGIIATRFHSLILGLVFGIPVYPLVYSNKTSNLLDDINFNSTYTRIQNMKELKSETVLNQLFSEPVTDVAEQKIKSNKHFTRLDEILRN